MTIGAEHNMDRNVLVKIAAKKARVIRKFEVMTNDMKIKKDLDGENLTRSAGHIYFQLIRGNKRSVRMMAIGEDATKHMFEIAERFDERFAFNKGYETIKKPNEGYKTINVENKDATITG